MNIPAFSEPVPMLDHILEFVDAMDRSSLMNAQDCIEMDMLTLGDLMVTCRWLKAAKFEFNALYWVHLMALTMIKERLAEEAQA